MALLDLQGMDFQDAENGHGDSDLSVVACTVKGGSSLSLTLCDID
jgi:hypothetical protein